MAARYLILWGWPNFLVDGDSAPVGVDPKKDFLIRVPIQLLFLKLLRAPTQTFFLTCL